MSEAGEAIGNGEEAASAGVGAGTAAIPVDATGTGEAVDASMADDGVVAVCDRFSIVANSLFGASARGASAAGVLSRLKADEMNLNATCPATDRSAEATRGSMASAPPVPPVGR